MTPHAPSLNQVLSAIPLLFLAACSSLSVPFLTNKPATEAVVYALGTREGYTSPLNANLKPACQALAFESESLDLTTAHERTLQLLVEELGKNKTKLLIVGYAPPGLPQDHARSLSERRAQGARQRLIEQGLEAGNIQTVGFGNDFAPSGPSSDVVVIYRQ